tara:strand:- start:210 stop:737 length:528 start_codon:yes stop_codon:yes gene_type:complete
MIYCEKCGSITENINVEGDSIRRDVCKSCSFIRYINPKIIVGVLPVKDESILLCKRDIEPSKGKWTIPSGFMEMNESLEDGARRESIEEANCKFDIIRLYGTYSIPVIGQVLFVFLGKIINNDYRAMDETSEVRLFPISKIPWDQIAFPSVKFFLSNYVNDNSNGKKFLFHSNFS